MMQSISIFALAALLSTSVSGNALSSQTAGCNSKPFSTSEGVSGYNSHDACTQWVEGATRMATFVKGPLRLNSGGSVETASVETCVSAINLIVEQCFREGIFYGGSVTIQGVHYSIEQAENVNDPRNDLEVRETHNKPKRGADKTKPKKAAPKKAADKTAPKKAADKTAPKKAADKTTPEKPADKATPKQGADKTVPKQGADKTTPKKGADKAKACKLKPAKNAPKKGQPTKPKVGRALLFELVHRSLTKRNKKHGKICGKTEDFDAIDYPSPDEVKAAFKSKNPLLKNSRTLAYGFEEECSSTGMDLESWTFGEADSSIPGTLDVEHIMEWQSVTGFFDYLDTKYQFCKDYKSIWKTEQLQGKALFAESPEKGTFHQYVQRGFPSKEVHTEEFVLLSHRPNSPFKQNLIGAVTEPLSDTAFDKEPIGNLESTLALALYLSDPVIHSLYGVQVLRMGRALGAIEILMTKHLTDAGKKDKIKKYGKGLQLEFVDHMKSDWPKAIDTFFKFFDSKAAKYEKKWDCKGKKPAAECKKLAAINKSWTAKVNKKTLRTIPWAGSNQSVVGDGTKEEDLNDQDMLDVGGDVKMGGT